MEFGTMKRAKMMAGIALFTVPLFAGCSASIGETTRVNSGAVSAPSPHVLPASMDLGVIAKPQASQRFVRMKTSLSGSFDGMGSATMTSTITQDTQSGNVEVSGSIPALWGNSASNQDKSEYTLRIIASDIYLQLGASEKWMKISGTFASGQLARVPLSTKDLLDMLAKAGVTMTKDGTVSRNGQTLTRYTGTIDARTLLANQTGNDAALKNMLASDASNAKIQVTLLVTDAGIPVQVVANGDLGGTKQSAFTLTIDYETVADNPEITAPDASEVTDFASGMKGYLTGGN